MSASVFSSALYGQLFPTGEVGRLWSDSAEVRGLLLVAGALAKVQGAHGIIPEISAAFIHRASLEVQIDPAGLAEGTGQNGVSIPALVAAFRAAMEAPEHAQYVHWGATSQDILDTGLMLRLRQTLAQIEGRMDVVLRELGALARDHADLPMAARTYGQHATPTSFGAICAQWGAPLADARDRLEALRRDTLWVSLSGAAGTAQALGPEAHAVRAALAEALRLQDPGRSWHTDRTPVLHIAHWMSDLVAGLGVMGQGVLGLAASDVGEVQLSGAGASSTMPQKQNPVQASALVALNHQMAGLCASLQVAAQHQHQRDGSAWFTEWMVLPQIALSAASAIEIAAALVAQITPNTQAMAANLARSAGAVHAEALSFALARSMPRPEAQAEVKRLMAVAAGGSLEAAARAAHDLPATLFDPAAQMGDAPQSARAFADRVLRA